MSHENPPPIRALPLGHPPKPVPRLLVLGCYSRLGHAEYHGQMRQMLCEGRRPMENQAPEGKGSKPECESSKPEGKSSNDAAKDQSHEDDKYFHDLYNGRITHRRDRRQQIFSWASGLLVAITGGTVALTYKNQFSNTSQSPPSHGQSLAPEVQFIIVFAVSLIGLYAFSWINYHWWKETNAEKELQKYESKLGISEERHHEWSLDWWNSIAIILLTLAAFSAVWPALAIFLLSCIQTVISPFW
jgi:hypothetical protein